MNQTSITTCFMCQLKKDDCECHTAAGKFNTARAQLLWAIWPAHYVAERKKDKRDVGWTPSNCYACHAKTEDCKCDVGTAQ